MPNPLFKNSRWGSMVQTNEQVSVKGNKATVSGVDVNGNPYKNYFKIRDGEWTFNGYSGQGGQVKKAPLRFPKTSLPIRHDSKAQQKQRLGNKGK